MSGTQTTYNDKVVRQFAVMTVIWGIVGMLVGVIIAAQLVWPDLNIGFLHFLNIDILERDDTHVLDETTGTIDVPHPRVGQTHVEIHILTGGTHIEIDFICQIKTTFRLNNVSK